MEKTAESRILSNGKRRRAKLNAKKKGNGSVVIRGEMLSLDFTYMGERVRESTGLRDTPENRVRARGDLDWIVTAINNGSLDFGKCFPKSRKKDHFDLLQGKVKRHNPEDVLIGHYYDHAWLPGVAPGMSLGYRRDLNGTMCHIAPYFWNMSFGELNPFVMKKFVAKLISLNLSAKRIRNIIAFLRTITRDAFQEHHWPGFAEVFTDLNLPKIRRTVIKPFNYEEWRILIKLVPPWYVPYFWFFVLTGLRPSEQVALRWTDIDFIRWFVNVQLSRVRGHEKPDLKTESSRRTIDLRPSVLAWLEKQRAMTSGFDSPYVFINTKGRPILQDKMRELWERVMKKSGLPYRRMYEIRHTFASWMLSDGETPQWVAQTLGHSNTAMVYKVYGRYIRDLNHKDGSAFEAQYEKEFGEEAAHE